MAHSAEAFGAAGLACRAGKGKGPQSNRRPRRRRGARAVATPVRARRRVWWRRRARGGPVAECAAQTAESKRALAPTGHRARRVACSPHAPATSLMAVGAPYMYLLLPKQAPSQSHRVGLLSLATVALAVIYRSRHGQVASTIYHACRCRTRATAHTGHRSAFTGVCVVCAVCCQ